MCVTHCADVTSASIVLVMSRGKYDIWDLMVSGGSLPHDVDHSFNIYGLSQSSLSLEDDLPKKTQSANTGDTAIVAPKRVSFADCESESSESSSVISYSFMGSKTQDDTPTYLSAYYAQVRKIPQFLVSQTLLVCASRCFCLASSIILL